jgi:hypothetical protein
MSFSAQPTISSVVHPTTRNSGNRIEAVMTDPYQVNSIIATAICEARGDHPDKRMDSEEALRIAKCIVEALTAAGLEIVPADAR